MRVADDLDALGPTRIPDAGTDLVLGCDMVVATSETALTTYERGRTRAIINDHLVPVATFANQPDMVMDPQSRKQRDEPQDALAGTQHHDHSRETMAISGVAGVRSCWPSSYISAPACRSMPPRCDDGSSAWGSDIGVRDRRCAFATRTRQSACRPLLMRWPIVAPTVRCSMPTRPTSTSTRESAPPGWPGDGRAGFLLRARTEGGLGAALGCQRLVAVTRGEAWVRGGVIALRFQLQIGFQMVESRSQVERASTCGST